MAHRRLTLNRNRSINQVRIPGGGGGRAETVSAGHAALKVVAGQRNSTFVRLRVRWSQVQVLSARCRKDALTCYDALPIKTGLLVTEDTWGPRLPEKQGAQRSSRSAGQAASCCCERRGRGPGKSQVFPPFGGGRTCRMWLGPACLCALRSLCW